jgi:predicted nucleotidyltransferase
MSRDKEIAHFLDSDGYSPHDVDPLVMSMTGSRVYGLNTEESDRDFVAVHITTLNNCLEHPDFRENLQVIRKRFDNDLKEIPEGVKGGDISLDSFEIWKFITLWTKGAPVSYEILYHEPSYCDGQWIDIFKLMRDGISNRIGRAARGIAIHDWRKNKNNRKKTVMAYFRLTQALHFLRDGKFEWNAGNLLHFTHPITNFSEELFSSYKDKEVRSQPLTDAQTSAAEDDLLALLTEVDKAMIGTKFPDQVPKNNLDLVLKKVKEKRFDYK